MIGVPQFPIIKPKGFMNALNKLVIDGIPAYADSKRFPNVIGTLEWQRFWEEELYKIINGIEIKGIWIPGRFYYYMNYKQMSTIKGVVTPDMTDLHLELAYYIEYCRAAGHNLICAKGRRKGISEAASTMIVDYGWRFSDGYKVGVAAGSKTYIDDFLSKWRFADSRLPPELSIKKLTDNDNEIIAGYTIRNEHGNFQDKGTFSTIYARTMHTNPNMFKGLFLNDVIAEEIGEFEKFLEFYTATKDTLMSGNKQIGLMTAFGCVCAGTKVWNNNGDFINIEDLVHSEGILGFDQKNGTVSKEFISYWQPPAEKMCYRITTNTGRYLECSEDHPILIRKKGNQKKRVSYLKNLRFEEAKDVVIGDNLSIAEEVDVWSDKRMFEPRIIGWAVGDGSYGWHKDINCFTIKMTSADDEVYDYISSKYKTRIDYSAPTKDGRILRKFGVNGIYLRDAFREMGIVGQTKENKHLPKNIHSYCKKDVCEFIGGYFDADGCIYHNVRTKETFLKLTSAHYHLLDEMRFLLQKVGVRCNIMYEKPNFNNPKTTRGHYNLIIKDAKSILCFHDNIHFKIKRKQNKFNKAVKTIELKLLKKANIKKGIRFETVVSVECIGMKPIYNLTAATTNTYLANGIITHNTGGAVNKGSKDFEEIWRKAESYNFVKFLIPATRMYYYGGAKEPERQLPRDTELYKKWKPYELIGVEDRTLAEYNIKKNRELILSSGNQKAFNEDFQNNPLNEEEIFKKTVVNNFNSILLNKQRTAIQTLVYPKWTKYKLEWAKDSNGRAKARPEVVYKALKQDEHLDECVWILDDGFPQRNYLNRYSAGLDSYDQDTAKLSKSLGAMCVIDRITKIPVAVVCCRPRRKELFYELCMKVSVMYNLVNNTLVDIANGVIISHYEQAGLRHLLADRPRKFESEGSEQTHEKGFRLTTYSKPRMISEMQSHIEDYSDKIWFPDLIDQLGNYDEVEIGSDNDLADAYGIALVQDKSFDVIPQDQEKKIENQYTLPKFIDDGRGGLRMMSDDENRPLNIQEDRDLLWDMFGPIE